MASSVEIETIFAPWFDQVANRANARLISGLFGSLDPWEDFICMHHCTWGDEGHLKDDLFAQLNNSTKEFLTEYLSRTLESHELKIRSRVHFLNHVFHWNDNSSKS